MAFAWVALAQDEPPLFRAGVTLVRVDVQVLDRGQPVQGLTVRDFLVREEGVPQTITGFGQSSEPLQLLFVLDVSGSMNRLLRETAAAAEQALGALGPQDEVGVLFYATRHRLAQEFTADRRSVLLALRSASEERELGGGSSLYDALLAACEVLRGSAAWNGRRAIFVLTDNGGVSRSLPHEVVLRAISGVNAVVAAAVPRGARPPEPPPPGVEINPDYTRHNVFLLCEKSGGEAIRMEKAAQQLRPMLERLRTRYLLSYQPAPAPPGVFRSLEVEVTEEVKKRLRSPVVRARAGYFTEPPP